MVVQYSWVLVVLNKTLHSAALDKVIIGGADAPVDFAKDFAWFGACKVVFLAGECVE